MQEIHISGNEAGQRLDKLLSKFLSDAPKSFLYKMMRKKNITLNGKKAEPKLDSGSKLITKENLYEDENQRLLYPFSGQ